MIREPSCAGSFYPEDPTALQTMVSRLVDQADVEPLSSKALIAPHAGYQYSGATAGIAYASLANRSIKRVVLIGPSHYHSFSGVAATAATHMRTPLGLIPLNLAALTQCLETKTVFYWEEPFEREHSLEVHLPFIQSLFDKPTLVPLVIGNKTPIKDLEALLSTLWGAGETLIVVSSDLSHYLNSQTARVKDQRTAQKIETFESVSLEEACGARAIDALLVQAQRRDLRATTQSLKNSADITDNQERVVGYGAWTFEPGEQAALSPRHRSTLLSLAREALEKADPSCRSLETLDLPLRAMRRVFVTLNDHNGALRGCIGSVSHCHPLASDVCRMTVQSMRDPRFDPVTPEQASQIHLSISILSYPRPIPFQQESELYSLIRPQIDGLILIRQQKHGLFLPTVWEAFPEPQAFIRNLKRKTGLDDAHPLDSETKVFRFTVETISESSPS